MGDEEIRARLDEVRGRIDAALSRARRPTDSCRLVVASKTQTAAAVAAAVRAGVREFGENYVHEGVAKRAVLESLLQGSGPSVSWHLIGHLQTNKVRAALAAFDLIQTIDSERLAAALFRARPQPLVPALIEINLGSEPAKSGIAAEQAEKLLEATRGKLEILGLMTIPPQADAAKAGAYFAKLRELRDRLAAATGLKLSELSMGMSDDYEIAIAEGATIVRVGRAVFGERTS